MMISISNLRFALLAATLAFTSLAASLHAQTAQRVQVNVPFAFQNGSEVLPAGVYTLTEGSHILTIQGHDNSGMALSMVEDSRIAPKTGKVVFQRYGDKYFLSQVWQANQSAHTVCITTNEEKKAIKAAQAQVAASKTAAPTVEIAALSPAR